MHVIQFFRREVYLARHHLPINATHVNSSIEACLVMSIYDITAKSLVCSNSTIIWALDAIKTKLVLLGILTYADILKYIHFNS